MGIAFLQDHPARYSIANELHARPFAITSAPCYVAFLVMKSPEDGASSDLDRELNHLKTLLDRFGAEHPPPDATHYSGKLGHTTLKWECHTEFVTYTLFSDGLPARPFDTELFEFFPEDWLQAAPGRYFTSGLIRVEQCDYNDPRILESANQWFLPESLAVSSVLDNAAVVATDFRVDANGHIRFAIFVAPDTGPARIGRIVQRVCEIEMYKAMAMLGLPKARELNRALSKIDPQLASLFTGLHSEHLDTEQALMQLLPIATQLEQLSAQTEFRFGATKAYEMIVTQRIKILREVRFNGMQTLAEFMFRRFDPAMRTVKSLEQRLGHMTERVVRAGSLLRTQVEVERSGQNQKLLKSLDRRADTQLRLQKTVEGLSVVAISYYTIAIGKYMLQPLIAHTGITTELVVAGITPPVLLTVWLLIHRLTKAIHRN